LERTWTNIGKEHSEQRHDELGAMFDRMDWQELPCSIGMMPGLAIKEAIKQLRIPKVSHVAHSHELAPYGLEGIIGHYKNGEVRVYLIDTGTEITPLASDFYASTLTPSGERWFSGPEPKFPEGGKALNGSKD